MWWDDVDWQDPINRDCPLNRGLVGWWMGAPGLFGGTRLWDLCNRNHGTLTNMNTVTDWTTDTPTGGSGSLAFDGSNDHVSVPYNRSLDINGDMSVFAWIRLATTGASGRNRWVFARGLYGSDLSGDYWLKTDDTIAERFNGMVYTSSGFQKATSTVSVPVNTWQHIGYTLNGSAMRLWLNGSQVGSLTVAGTRTKNNHSAWIGGSTTAVSCFSGSINYVTVHTYGLTAAEVYATYVESLTGFPNMLNHFARRRIVVPFVDINTGAAAYYYRHLTSQVLR